MPVGSDSMASGVGASVTGWIFHASMVCINQLNIIEQIATAEIDDPQHGIRIASDLSHPWLDVIVRHGRKIDELYLDVLISHHAGDRLGGS